MSLSKPIFKKGDEVTFELSNRYPNNLPRWIIEKGSLKDTTGCEKWTTGVVEKVSPTHIEFSYTIEGYVGTGNFSLPNIKSASYTTEMWENPGFVKLVSAATKAECECGSESVYGSKTVHADWCPKHKES